MQIPLAMILLALGAYQQTAPEPRDGVIELWQAGFS
jgi:hypothetical protein